MRRALLVLLFAAALAGLAGCGGEEDKSATPETVEGTTTAATTTEQAGGEGDAAAGKEVFSEQGCGSCHMLADAGASGTIGPNLDESQPDHDLVVERVTNGQGAMPSFKGDLSEQQIQDVAAYVSGAAGS